MSSCQSCQSQSCNTCPSAQEMPEALQNVKKRLVVMSGKGGVGKSTVAVNLAISLAREGHKVGLLDVDVHGPSIPTMLGTTEVGVEIKNEKIMPREVLGLKVMSTGFIINHQDDAVIWRGPMKATLIKQFTEDVAWGELDYLIIDCPPGTGDEPLSVIQSLKRVDGAILVTTPQVVATTDVRKSIQFCKKMELPILGVIENMSGVLCPHCQEIIEIFKKGGGMKMAQEFEIPFLGTVPLDPQIVECGDDGKPWIYQWEKSQSAMLFQEIVLKIREQVQEKIS